MLIDATPIKVLNNVSALNTLSEIFGLTDDIVVEIDFKTGVNGGAVQLESAPGGDYSGTWTTELTITFAGSAPLVLSDRIIPEGAVGRLRISSGITGGVIDAYIQRSLAR
jgi:hypothetical protein